jgi:hypothetical protein
LITATKVIKAMSGGSTSADFAKEIQKSKAKAAVEASTPSYPGGRTKGGRGFGGRGSGAKRGDSSKKKAHPTNPWEGEPTPEQDLSSDAVKFLEKAQESR